MGYEPRLLACSGFRFGEGQPLRQGLWWFLCLGGIVAITALPLGLVTQLLSLTARPLLMFSLVPSFRLDQAYPGAPLHPIGSPQ